MEKFCFDDYAAFVCVIADSYTELTDVDDLSDVTVVAYYDAAKEIVTHLLCMGYSLYDIHLCDPEIDAYFNEYYISLNSDGVWCERAIGDKGYLFTESSLVYVLDDCSSKVLNNIESENIIEVCVGSCDECDEHSNQDVHVGQDDDCNECEFLDDCLKLEKEFFDKGSGSIELTCDDMPGFSLCKETDNSSTRISFYSTDKDLVKEMAKFYR